MLDDLLGDARENLRLVGCEFREDFTIELKIVFLELCDEGGVGLVAGLTNSGVQAHYPELAEVGLLVAAVGERVAAGAHKRLMCEVELLGTDAAVTLGSFKDILSALVGVYATFDSCHT